ncbi:MAG: DNA-binding transcriptional regulator [Planctomycetota bacterium]
MFSAPRVILLLQAARGFDRGLLSGISRYASLNGPWTFYREPHGYFVRKSATRKEELKRWRPNGVVCPVRRLDLVRPLRVPIVAIDVNDYGGKIPGVVSEDQRAGQLAAEHLLGLGLEAFAYCGIAGMRWSQDRCDAFLDAVTAAGRGVQVYRSPRKQPVAWATEEAHVHRWLNSLPKPIGLFCANDDRAANILEACRSLGFGVPEDVAVVGVDDDPYVCDLLNPPLTSVAMSSDRAGYEAAALLHRMMTGEERMAGQRILAPADRVSARQSTDITRVRDPDVRKALNYIRENISQPLQVSDVVRATDLSHRTLNDRFHRECGSSILRQLTRARVAHISRLLRETSLPVGEIALMVGFDSDHHFARYFQRAAEITPQAYRRKFSPP